MNDFDSFLGYGKTFIVMNLDRNMIYLFLGGLELFSGRLFSTLNYSWTTTNIVFGY